MRIDADPDSLAGDGARLAGEQSAPRTTVCVAPGGDPVSVSIAAQLSAHGASLEALIEHSGLLRLDGGVVTQHTAYTFRAADAHNAAMLTGAPVTAAALAPMARSAPPAPALPGIPPITAPPVMPGEVLATLMHEGGPGPDGLRQFASHWRIRAAELDDLAARIHATAGAIDNDWDDDGLQRAGANTREHGDWLQAVATSARQLAGTADDQADHFQRAVDATPTPQEFEEARLAWQQAVIDNARTNGMLFGKVGALAAQYADKQGRATEAGHTFYAAARVSGGDVPRPPRPAPPITTPAPPADSRPGTGQPSQPSATADDEGPQPRDPHPGGSGLDDRVPGTGTASNPDGSESGPIGPAQVPASGGIGAPPPVSPEAAGQAANIAGTLVGAGVGAMSQLAQGMAPSGQAGGLAGAPLSALSGLSSLPGLPNAPSVPGGGMPSDPGMGSPGPEPDVGSGAPFDATSPALGDGGGGGGVGGGGGGGLLAGGSLGPASAAGPQAGVVTAPPAAPSASAPAGGYGPMGMYPPMMGGQGGQNTERNKDLFPDKRVVLRPVANTEPVFGALEQELRPRAKRAQEEDGAGARAD